MKRYIRSARLTRAQQFDEWQTREIQEGLKSGVDVSIYADPKFNWAQMYRIRQGLESGLDVSIYADPKFDPGQMDNIRQGLEHGVDLRMYANDWVKCKAILDELESTVNDPTFSVEDSEYTTYDEACQSLDFSEIENEVMSELGLYIDFSGVRDDYGIIWIFADPEHKNNADMWMGDLDEAIAYLDFAEYATDIESEVLQHPENEWREKYSDYLSSLI